MTAPPGENKYERFKRNTNIDLKAEIAAGGTGTVVDLSNYYTKAQSDANLNTGLGTKQPIASDLTSIANLVPSNNDVIQRKTGAWVNSSPAQLKTDLGLTKTDVGLSNVDNTADTAKPVSTAQQTALNAKLTIASNLSDVAVPATARTNLGLGNVDNTTDIAKPVSTATQTALNAKLTATNNLSDVTVPATARTNLGLGNVDNTSDAAKPVSTAQQTALNAKLTTANNLSEVVPATARTNLGLGNLDNTSDINKPISSATQTALNTKEATIAAGTTAQYWSGDKTWQTLNKTAVGLASVDNTADVSKPVSTAQQAALDVKVDSPMLPVANGTHFNGNWGNPSTSLIQARCRQSRKLLRVIAGGASKLQVEWANKYTTTVPQTNDASCELNNPNAVTVRMAIEYPAGKPRQTSGSVAWSSATAYVQADQVTSGGFKWVALQSGTNQVPADGSAYWRKVNTYVVRWNGDTDTSGTVVFQPGDYKKSGYVNLIENTAVGDLIAIIGAFDSGNATNYIPYAGSNGAANHGTFVDWIVDATGGLPAIGSALPDTGVTTQTNGNTTTANDSNNQNWMKIPYATAITGNIPIKNCVAIFGDSIAQGFGGDMRDGEPCGIFPKSLDGTTWWRIAQGGNRASCYTLNNAPWQYSVAARCSSIIVSIGLNDITQGATFATGKTYLERLWRALAAQGPPVYAGQLTPFSSSTDAWATTTNQTRYTGAATTQYPNDDATYLTSVYGQLAMWITQDGAQVTIDGSTTVKAGQAGHPLEAILDWRSFMADLATSWKWAASFTTDGAHPTPTCVTYQVSLLAPQLEPVIRGAQQQPQPFPAGPPYGVGITESMPRTLVSSTATPATGSIIAITGTSSGRWAFGVRVYSGTATAKAYTILQAADLAKMKVVQSGNSPASVGVAAIAFTGSPLWIPAGQALVVVLATPAANSWGGVSVLAGASALNVSPFGYILAGTSTDTAALTGVVNAHQNGGKFTSGVFKAWAEIY